MKINNIDFLLKELEQNLNFFEGQFLDRENLDTVINIVQTSINHYNDSSKDKLKDINKLNIALSFEKDIKRLLDMILYQALEFTNSDAGTLYLKDTSNKKLLFTVIQNRSLHIRLGGLSEKIEWPPLNLFQENSQANTQMVAALCALTNRSFLIDDVYNYGSFNFTGAKKFDAQNSYRTKSMLVVPMKNYKSHIIGVLQLINKMDMDKNIIPFDTEDRDLTISFASSAASAITRARQEKLLDYQDKKIQRQKELLEDFLHNKDLRVEENKTTEDKAVKKEATEDKKGVLSAVEYMSEFDDDTIEHIYELEDLENDWFDILDRGDISVEDKIEQIAKIIMKMSSTIKLFLEFEDISSSLKTLSSYLIEKRSFESDLLFALDKIQEILSQWKQTIFIERSVDDIHYLDEEIIQRCSKIQIGY